MAAQEPEQFTLEDAREIWSELPECCRETTTVEQVLETLEAGE